MAYDPAVPPCPRCGVPMPANAHFCRNCKLTQSEAQEMRLRAAAAPAPVAAYQAPVAAPAQLPASVPANDPFARGRHSRVYRSPSAAYLDNAPPRTFWTSLWGILVVVCLVLLVLGISGVAIFYYSSICSLGERNYLRGDIPLPCGTTFRDHLDRSASGTTGKGSEEWVYSVDGTSPARIQSFYMQQLPQNGWSLPPSAQSVFGDNPALKDLKDNTVLACKSGTVVVIIGIAGPTQTNPPKAPTPTATPITNPDDGVRAPLQGSLLDIILLPGKNLSKDTLTALNDPDCSG